MRYKSFVTSFVRFVTIHAFDRLTDGQTAFLWLYHALHYMQSRGENWSKCCFWMSRMLLCSCLFNSTWLFFYISFPIFLQCFDTVGCVIWPI